MLGFLREDKTRGNELGLTKQTIYQKQYIE